MELSGTGEIYVKTNLHTNNLDRRIGTGTSSILAKISVVLDNVNLIYYSNITQNRIILKDRTINNIQVILVDDEENLSGLTMDYGLIMDYDLRIDIHIIPNKFLIYSQILTNGND